MNEPRDRKTHWSRHAELPDLVSPVDAQVLAAAMRLHAAVGRVTIRDIANEIGGAPIGAVHNALYRLQRRGLVDWQPFKAGTLRPTVRIVAVAR